MRCKQGAAERPSRCPSGQSRAASGSYVEDETTGETMELVEKGGMYMLKLWVKAQGFKGLDEA